MFQKSNKIGSFYNGKEMITPARAAECKIDYFFQ